jgi:hypothetical protein
MNRLKDEAGIESPYKQTTIASRQIDSDGVEVAMILKSVDDSHRQCKNRDDGIDQYPVRV